MSIWLYFAYFKWAGEEEERRGRGGMMDRKITWRLGRTEIAPSLPYGCRTRGGIVAWDSGTVQPGESCDHGKGHLLGGDKLPLQMPSTSVCVCVYSFPLFKIVIFQSLLLLPIDQT